MWRELQSMSGASPGPATTGTDGRFRLPGPGRDRVASLRISGPMIATGTLYALGRDEPEVRTIDQSWVEPSPLIVHAPRFVHVAAPTKPIEGVIRDKDTGEPIAGVNLKANIENDSDHTMIEGLEATTDARGRYRLVGLPKAPGYFLFAFMKDDFPYTNGFFRMTADTPALEPVRHDIAMRR